MADFDLDLPLDGPGGKARSWLGALLEIVAVAAAVLALVCVLALTGLYRPVEVGLLLVPLGSAALFLLLAGRRMPPLEALGPALAIACLVFLIDFVLLTLSGVAHFFGSFLEP